MNALPIRHVLLAVDFSAAAARARRFAIDLAERCGAELTILFVLEPIGYPYVLTQPESVRAKAENDVQMLVVEARKRIDAVRGVVRDGVAATEIVDAARELRADLVVVGTHGWRGVRHALFGSTAERVVRTSTVPVMTVTAWRFDDRSDAAKVLASKLSVPSPGVLLGLGREGAALAAEMSKEMGIPADVMSRDDADVRALRAKCPAISLAGRAVVLIAERALDARAIVDAAETARKAGATCVLGAFAAIDARTSENVKRTLDGVAEADVTEHRDEVECALRIESEPTIGALARRLLATRVERPAAVASSAEGE